SRSRKSPCPCRAIRSRPCGSKKSGSARIAISTKKPKRKKPEGVLAGADGEQDFLAERIFEFLELQRRFTLVTEHFEHGRTAFFRHFHASILKMNHVHLQRFDLKVPVVAAIWTSQRHARLP